MTHAPKSRRRVGGWVALAVLVVGSAGCDGPFIWLPGGRLAGQEATLTVDAAPDGGVIELETRPDDPYSVNIGFQRIDGMLLIDPAEERRWYRHLQENANVRVRFEGDPVVYAARVLPVTDPDVLARFEPDRHVLQLLPR